MKILKTKLKHGDASKIAEAWKLTPQSITNILSGKTKYISTEMTRYLADFVGCPIEEIATEANGEFYLKNI
jgi:plasmid maintenance system antidote protein VapI